MIKSSFHRQWQKPNWSATERWEMKKWRQVQTFLFLQKMYKRNRDMWQGLEERCEVKKIIFKISSFYLTFENTKTHFLYK